MKQNDEILLIETKNTKEKEKKVFGKNYHFLSSVSDSTDDEDLPLLNRNEKSQNEEEFNSVYYKKEDSEYYNIVKDIEKAIEMGLEPERISQGSSGSYFVKNTKGEIVGVFKPKDEEPYGQLNPKWTKWIHKHCCFCCFGRSCLVPNQGYLSEAGASLVDEALGLNIVPKTRVIRLSSNSFNYGPIDRYKSKTKEEIAQRFPAVGKKFHRIGLPPKIGSLQLFVNGYKDACYWLQKFDSESLHEDTYRKFRSDFEKLAVIDFIIRNTDRGNDNWLIKYEKPENPLINNDTGEWDLSALPEIKIAAIDNGLAFPFKSPDNWRLYPFGWTFLPIADIPFSEETRNLVLPKLTDETFIKSLFDSLYQLFKTDPGFDPITFRRQMALMRGQIANLVKALNSSSPPSKLIRMPPMSIISPSDKLYLPEESSFMKLVSRIYGDSFLTAKYHKKPYFNRF